MNSEVERLRNLLTDCAEYGMDEMQRAETAEAEVERLRAQIRVLRDGLSPTLTGLRAELDAILDGTDEHG